MNHLSKKLLFLGFGLAMLTAAACNIIDPPEEIPATLYVEPFVVLDNPDLQEGHRLQKITALDLFVGGDVVGIVSLPGQVPVYTTGEVEAIAFPLVQLNGDQLQLTDYAPLERFTKTLTLTPGQTDTLRPQTRYVSEYSLVIEGFENNDLIFTEDLDGDTLTRIVSQADGALPGAGESGKIELTAEHPIFEAASNIEIDLAGSTDIWLEVHYRTDVDIRFGVIDVTTVGAQSPVYQFGVLPKENWNKVYYNMRDLVTSLGLTKVRLAVTAFIPAATGSPDFNEAEVWLDNLKLVYR